MDRLPVLLFVLVYVCLGVRTTVAAAAIPVLVLHVPRTGPWGIQRWVVYGIGYTVTYTGFALWARHLRVRQRRREARPGPPPA